MYPSDPFFLKALFLRGPSVASGRLRAISAQRCVDKAPFPAITTPAMDFSRSGTTERVGASFRAHVQWNDKGKQHAHGPNRPDEEAAKEDLESMRAAASGKSREDGFAAMKAEADALKAGKPPKEVLQAANRCRRP